jgi:hypothetical protein
MCIASRLYIRRVAGGDAVPDEKAILAAMNADKTKKTKNGYD